VNGDSKSTNERGSFLGWFVVLVVPYTIYFSSALAALIGPVQNIFFLAVHHFNSFEPIAQKAGQAAVLGRLSLSMCLWFIPKPMPELFHQPIALIPHQL
jgi:hypothetical protein